MARSRSGSGCGGRSWASKRAPPAPRARLCDQLHQPRRRRSDTRLRPGPPAAPAAGTLILRRGEPPIAMLVALRVRVGQVAGRVVVLRLRVGSAACALAAPTRLRGDRAPDIVGED